MTTNRKLTIGIIGLLVINLIVVSFLITGHKKGGDRKNSTRHNPAQIIIKKLDFNESQVASLNTLKESHKKNVHSKDEEIRAIKKTIFNSLGDQTSVNIDSLSSMIGAIQEDIEVAHYEHFLRIKALCNEDQLPKFTELSKELSKIFNRKKGHTSRKK